MDIYGIVLAGGRSRRMMGPDKVFCELAGRPLLSHVLARLGPQCRGLVISRNEDPARLEAFGQPVVTDDVPGFAGPLAGLLSGLTWIAAHHPRIESAVSCAVDVPFLPPDLVGRLVQAAQRARVPGACAVSGGRRHPVAALWPVASRHDLRDVLEDRRDLSVSTMLARLGCAEAEWLSEPFDPFFNINTQADLDLARHLIGKGIVP